MRSKILLFFLSAILFFSCDTGGGKGPVEIPPSSDNALLDISIEGLLEEAQVNEEDRTVVFSIPPMDMSTLDLSVNVPEDATLGNLPETIEDGVPFEITITAENGDVAEWTVTVNMQYGVSFLLDGERKTLNYGTIDSQNAANNTGFANGVPAILYTTGNSMFTAHISDTVADYSQGQPTSGNFFSLYFYGTETGELTLDNNRLIVNYIKYGANDGSQYYQHVSTNGFSVNLIEVGNPGGQVTGTFQGELSERNANGDTFDPLPFTEGYFKLIRLEDDFRPMDPPEPLELEDFEVFGNTQIGTSIIDQNNRTISAEVYPCSMADLRYWVGVNGGSHDLQHGAIEDGVAKSFTITSDDGSETQDWTVTITMKYGVSFELNGQRVFLAHGRTDSSDPVSAAALGGGIPAIGYDISDNMMLSCVNSTLVDIQNFPTSDQEFFFQIEFRDLTTGICTIANNRLITNYVKYSSFDYDAMRYQHNSDDSFIFEVLSIGAAGEDVEGSFRGNMAIINDPSGAAGNEFFASGYFKLLRLADVP